MIEKKFIFLIITICLVLFSCSLDYGSNNIEDSSAPELIFYNTELARYENGLLSTVLKAKELEQYSKDDAMYGKELEFFLLDKNGNKTITGSSMLLSADTKKELYYLYDKVLVTSYEQDIQIEADNLRWDNKTEQLISSKDSKIKLSFGYFSSNEPNTKMNVEGFNFSASGVDDSYVFNGNVEGTIITGDQS